MRRIAIVLLFSAGAAHADCWYRAGSRFNISPQLLAAIAQQESSLNPAAIAHNGDGSKDLGLMQINSRHLPRLRKLGIGETQLLKNPCLSVMVGASILSGMMQRYGYSWEAVGAYNAGTSPERYPQRMTYAKQVWQRYRKLIGARGEATPLPRRRDTM